MELVIDNLSHSYGQAAALKGFSAVFSPGIYGLLGPNGAGKSTLMNILAGLLRADSGNVLYDGRDIISMGKNYRAILGFMPQQQELYEGMSGLRFMHYMAALKGMGRKRASLAVPEALRRVGLYGERQKKLRAYSGGMKQRILIAQAILNDPRIIILDEPTAGLDPKQRIAIRNLISEISMHKIILIATHVVSDIAFIAKRVLLLDHGVLIRNDDIPALLDTVAGKVFITKTDENGLEYLKESYLIGGITKAADRLLVRFISGDAPDFPCAQADPTLEDVYLYMFGDESDPFDGVAEE